jgi:uncharacterized protein (TIGR03083 family)
MTVAELYRDGRERLLRLADEIDDEGAATSVPTCPQWTVKDVYAHQAGVPADILAGRLEGVATDEWTARQVAERADQSLKVIVAELAERGAELDPILAAAGDGIDMRLLLDQWTHEQDVRCALGKPGSRDVAVVPFAVDVMLSAFGRGWSDRGLAPVRIVGSSGTWQLGDGEPVATMQASDFELVRVLVGRRSRAQALARWDGDGEPFVDSLVAFEFASEDIDE